RDAEILTLQQTLGSAYGVRGTLRDAFVTCDTTGITAASFSPDSRWLALGEQKNAKIISLFGNTCAQLTHPEPISALALSSSSLLSGCRDDLARLWLLPEEGLPTQGTAELPTPLKLKHPAWISAVQLPASGGLFVTASGRRVRVWEE